MSSAPTHEDLRKAAVKWLTNNHCNVVLSELVSYAGEIPDAIGWKNSGSCLIECKVSRSDFLANANKCFIRSERGMGSRRFYLCSKGLITKDDLKGCDYGLLWLYPSGRILLEKCSEPRQADLSGEITMLVSALRRVKTREFLTLSTCQCEVPSTELPSPIAALSDQNEAGSGRTDQRLKDFETCVAPKDEEPI